MQRGESGNPFGGDDDGQLDPRGYSVTLDRDTLYSSWFQLADTGAVCTVNFVHTIFQARSESSLTYPA